MNEVLKKEEMLGVPIIVLNNQNQILLGERMNAYGAGLYGMPGGRIKLAEPMIEAVKRELLEETGLIVQTIEFVGAARELQKTGNFIHFGFVGKDVQGNPENLEPEKSKEWQWFNFNNLPTNLLPGHKAIIEMYLNSSTPRYRDLI